MSVTKKIKGKKSLEYKPKFSMEKRRRFWEHDLNPITGMPNENDNSQKRLQQQTKYHKDANFIEKPQSNGFRSIHK